MSHHLSGTPGDRSHRVYPGAHGGRYLMAGHPLPHVLRQTLHIYDQIRPTGEII